MSSLLDFVYNNVDDALELDAQNEIDPIQAFLNECEELESQCPNLALVRKHIKAFRMDMKPLPDCEINWNLGYVYDPEFRSKYWYYKQGCTDKDEEGNMFSNPISRSKARLPQKPRGYIAELEFRGYREFPWKTACKQFDECLGIQCYRYDENRSRKSINEKENTGKWCLEVHNYCQWYNLMMCCKNKNWMPFIKQNLTYIKEQSPKINKESQLYEGFEMIGDWEKIMTDHMKCYYKVMVMRELRWSQIKDLQGYDLPKFRKYTVKLQVGGKYANKHHFCSDIEVEMFEEYDTKIYSGEQLCKYLINPELYTDEQRVTDGQSYMSDHDSYMAFLLEKFNPWPLSYRPGLVAMADRFYACHIHKCSFWKELLKIKPGAECAFKLYMYKLRFSMLNYLGHGNGLVGRSD